MSPVAGTDSPSCFSECSALAGCSGMSSEILAVLRPNRKRDLSGKGRVLVVDRDRPRFGTQLAPSPEPCSVRRERALSMADTTIIAEPVAEQGATATSVSGISPSPNTFLPVLSPEKVSISPDRRASRSGQVILDASPMSRSVDGCEGCHLRAFCRCAYADFLAAGAREQRVWVVLALTAAVTILYVVSSFFNGR
jgi:hypothetical protein